MIESLHIKNFLAFPELVVPELKLINLVAGKNGVGKTALLQALNFEYNADKYATISKIGALRNVPDHALGHAPLIEDDYYNSFEINGLSYGLTTNNLSRSSSTPTTKTLTSGFGPTAEVITPVDNHSNLVRRWQEIVLTPDENEIINIMNKALDLELKGLSVLDSGIKVLRKGDHGPSTIESQGEGAKRLLFLAVAVVKAKGGLLLIDEIETHLHHTVIRKLWKIIFEYATKWNIQVVATTHSQDAIREFWYEAAEKEEYKSNSQVLRLQKDRDGKHEVIQFPFERLDTVLEMEMEIR